jgi:HEAT repeat protein
MVFARAASAAQPGVPELVESLAASPTASRLEAIDQLGAMGGQAAQAVPAMVQLLNDDSPAVRAHVLHALGRIGPAARSALPMLGSLVNDADKTVRCEAIQALVDLRADPKVLVSLLSRAARDADPTVRLHALDALVQVGNQAVPVLIEMLGQEQHQYWACMALAELGPEAAQAVPALGRLLDHAQPEMRREAILTLGEIGPAAAVVLPQLQAALDVDSLRLAAVYALGRIGPKARVVELRLRKYASDSDPLLCTVSAWALARLRPEDPQAAKRAVVVLARGLTAREPAVRAAAARALVDLHPTSALLLPSLASALEKADETVVSEAVDALAGLGEEAVPQLVHLLKFKPTRSRVVFLLGRSGPAARAAVKPLADLVSDENPQVQQEAIFALGQIGPEAAEAVPALIDVYQKGAPTVRYGAGYALGKIGPKAQAAKTALLDSLPNNDDFLGLVAAWALARIDPECKAVSPKAIPLLIKALEQPDAMIRLEAASSLRCLGPIAKPAVPALQQTLKDENALVRDMAAEALKTIGPP